MNFEQLTSGTLFGNTELWNKERRPKLERQRIKKPTFYHRTPLGKAGKDDTASSCDGILIHNRSCISFGENAFTQASGNAIITKKPCSYWISSRLLIVRNNNYEYFTRKLNWIISQVGPTKKMTGSIGRTTKGKDTWHIANITYTLQKLLKGIQVYKPYSTQQSFSIQINSDK